MASSAIDPPADQRRGAVSAGDGNDAFWGLGDTDGEARAEAQNRCASGGSASREVQVSQCSS